MNVIYLILLLLSGASFGLAAGRVAHKVDFIALGLLLWVLVPIIQTARGL